MRKISGILFDYDGTLVDSARKNMQVLTQKDIKSGRFGRIITLRIRSS